MSNNRSLRILHITPNFCSPKILPKPNRPLLPQPAPRMSPPPTSLSIHIDAVHELLLARRGAGAATLCAQKGATFLGVRIGVQLEGVVGVVGGEVVACNDGEGDAADGGGGGVVV